MNIQSLTSPKTNIVRSKSFESITNLKLEDEIGFKRTKSICGGVNCEWGRKNDSFVITIMVKNSNENAVHDSGIEMPTAYYSGATTMEKRFEEMRGLFKELNQLLLSLKDDIQQCSVKTEDYGNHHGQLIIEALQKFLQNPKSDTQSPASKSRARILLEAIEQKQDFWIQNEIKAAITNFLQTEELQKSLVSGIVDSLKEVIHECLYNEMTSVYVPMLRRSHRWLLDQTSELIEQVNKQYEHSSSYSDNKVTDKYQNWIRDMDTLSRPFTSMHDAFQDVDSEGSGSEWSADPDSIPSSPAQPVNPDVSIVEQLMRSAEIRKQIQDGDVSGSFKKALSALDLSLVMVACRAVDPYKVFTADLDQSIVLSIVQQLATDMVHETQLKCRYLEEAMVRLNSMSLSRSHLQMVVEDVCKHLTGFLMAYPGHMASRRIKRIIMAANSLL